MLSSFGFMSSPTTKISARVLVPSSTAEMNAKKVRKETATFGQLEDALLQVVAYNKAMPGWEVPMPLQLRAEKETTVDNTDGNKALTIPEAEQEVSSQVVAEGNRSGPEKASEESWAARLLKESPSLPASGKTRNVNNQLNTTRIQQCGAPDAKHIPKAGCQSGGHPVKLQSLANLRRNLLQGQAQVKNCSRKQPPKKSSTDTRPQFIKFPLVYKPKTCPATGPTDRKHPLKTSSTGAQPRFIKSDLVSKRKTRPAKWPALRSGEMEFMLDNPLSILPTRSVCSPSLLTVENFSFKILVFPQGSRNAAGTHLSAFVLAEPGDVEPDCIFKNVKFEITLVNWMDFTQSKVKSDTFSFKASGSAIDRGWHDLVCVDQLTTSESEWVGPTGSVCVRARCQVSSQGQWSSDAWE